MIQRLTDRQWTHSAGLSVWIALFLLLSLAAGLAGCGVRGEDPGQGAEETVSPEPPTLYPGVLDLPAATAAGLLRCAPGGPGPLEAPGQAGTPAVAVNLGPAPLSREFVEAYRLRPPWEPETPSFLPVDPKENERWTELMELRSRFLFRRDPATGGWRPDAAASAELNVAEGKLTVRLQEGLIWSDGTPASATDWVVAVEQIYQLPGVQSPLKAQTEAGGAVWRVLDGATIEVLFETIPPDPLAILAVPPLPLGEPRIASLAQGNLDVLFDLEIAKDELPTLRRAGETEIATEQNVVFVGSERPESLLAATGAGDRGLLLLLPSRLDTSGAVEDLLDTLRDRTSGSGLLVLPWEPVSSRDGERNPEGPGAPMRPELRIAYSFGPPGARRAADLLAVHLEDAGVEAISVVPENADAMETSLPLYLSGERPLPGDLAILEVAVDAVSAVPVSLRAADPTGWRDSCATAGVDGVDGWYDCIESIAVDGMATAISGSVGPVRLVPLGRLPRLVLLSPEACFSEPVPHRGRAVDLVNSAGVPEKEES